MTEASPTRADLIRVATGSPTGWLAMGLGSGLSPKAPGTVGSLAAMLFFWPWSDWPMTHQVIIIALAACVGIWVCQRAADALGVHDHGAIVWDEWVAMWALLACLPVTPGAWLMGFLLFRVFDIWKPCPIDWLDRRVGGGLGIMLDDGLAALYAGLVMAAGYYGFSLI